MIFKRKFWHDLFELSVALKGLNAAWETASGLFLLFTDHSIFHVHISASTRSFAGIYLLLHGILNIFLVYNLYKERLWAFPLTVWVLSLLLIYQAYRYSHTHSIILLGTIIFDICFIGLTWHEWGYQKKLRAK